MGWRQALVSAPPLVETSRERATGTLSRHTETWLLQCRGSSATHDYISWWLLGASSGHSGPNDPPDFWNRSQTIKGALYTVYPITRIAAPLLCQPRSGAQFTKLSYIVHSTDRGAAGSLQRTPESRTL